MMDENVAPTLFVGVSKEAQGLFLLNKNRKSAPRCVSKDSPGLTLNKESQYGRMERQSNTLNFL